MRSMVIAGLAVLAAVLVPAAAGDDPVELTVEAARPGAVIDRHIFGQFAEHLGHGIYEGVWVGRDSPIPNTRGIRNDVVAALRALHVPVVRWPGGCFADEYHWRRGIGPHRVAGMNANWGGVIEPNSFGTEEFMDFANQIGAEAYVSINVGSGTPGEAAEWLEYMTSASGDGLAAERAANGHPAPYQVAYIGIGNESWGCGGAMRPEFYVDLMKLYARYVRNYNPAATMRRIAVGPGMGDTAYTEAVMRAWHDHDWSWDIEGLSIHNYTTGSGWPPSFAATGFGPREYAVMLKETLGMDDLIRRQIAVMDRYDPEKKVALVVDEWGAWLAATPGSHPGFLAQQNSQRDAVLAALNLNIFARHADRVRMANIAQMVNVLQAMILTDGPRMLLTPTYHVFRLYVPFQDATLLPVSYDAGRYRFGNVSLPRVDAIAARDKTGKVWLALVNIDPDRPVSFTVSVPGVAAGRLSGETLAAPAIDAVNTFEAPSRVAPKPVSATAVNGVLSITLPPASVTVVALEP